MQMSDRSKALLEVFRQGLSHSGLLQTNLNLGDRQNYLGISDIALYAECPRHALASKLYPIRDDLSSQLTLQRGHWFENGVGESLASLGLNILPQLEISDTSHNAPIKAHLDFTLVWNKPELAVRVLEVKSVNQLPVSPHARHELQLSAQVALLQQCWDKPVFKVQDERGAIPQKPSTFPEICTKYFGFSLPDSVENISIEGWLLYLSMKDAMAFGPYAQDLEILDSICQAGEKFWNEFQAIKEGKITLNDAAYAQ